VVIAGDRQQDRLWPPALDGNGQEVGCDIDAELVHANTPCAKQPADHP
jgi:hypothetical protein